MSVLSTLELERLLFEDAPYGDLTTETLGIGAVSCRIRFVARVQMVAAAIEEAAALMSLSGIALREHVSNGTALAAGDVLLEGSGRAEAVLKAWKVAQTLVEIWSGVASAAREVVDAARSVRPEIVVACTRKNPPGTKALATMAVKAGGAIAHRLGLSESILVFPEHRALIPAGDLASLAKSLHARAPERKLVVEVNDVRQAIEAATAGFDVVQAEKFTCSQIAETAKALSLLPVRTWLAAAGGVHAGNAAEYAGAGADILVTSWPYTARPRDVVVTIVAA